MYDGTNDRETMGRQEDNGGSTEQGTEASTGAQARDDGGKANEL